MPRRWRLAPAERLIFTVEESIDASRRCCFPGPHGPIATRATLVDGVLAAANLESDIVSAESASRGRRLRRGWWFVRLKPGD